MHEDREQCIRAVQSKDARFDGWFFTAVLTTGIYCRPSCPVVPPKPENMRFFASAAAAQQGGFRACKRCRPDASPGSPEWDVRADVVARAMRLISDGVMDDGGVPALARRLGYSVRQVERQLMAELGAGPLALARAQRAQTARLLIETTALPMGDVAFAAGFASIRTFNDTVREVFALSPSQLRERAGRGGAVAAAGSLSLRLPFRMPLQPDNLFGHLAATAVPGVEEWRGGAYRRTLRLAHGHGIVTLRPAPDHVDCQLTLTDLRDLASAISRCRRLLDLDADPQAVDEVLSADTVLAPLIRKAPGRRVPRTVDPAEFALRAVLGQQISTAAARTHAGRLATAYGQPVDDPAGGLTRLFPDTAALAAADHADLAMPRTRRESFAALAVALASGQVDLSVGGDWHEARLQLARLPGLGPWTIETIAMRALGDPDAFIASDLGVRGSAIALGLPGSPAALTGRAATWRPWRAFGKTTPANRSLTRQFEQRAVRKKYVFLSDRETDFARLVAQSFLARAGDKYVSLPSGSEGAAAETSFTRIQPLQPMPAGLEGCFVWEAEPAAGRTHQIRVHAAAHGFPILGDMLYGGTPAARVYLHAAQLGFRHPATGENILFDAPPDFSANLRQTLRAAVIDPAATDAFRLLHGAADGWPGLYADRLGGFLLAQSAGALTGEQRAAVDELGRRFSARGLYHKIVRRQTGNQPGPEAAPQWLAGEKAPEEIIVRENGLRFALRLGEAGSPGLFLDQRENRRRLLTGFIAPDFTLARPSRVLNAFAYTCGFSVCAAAGGARVTSLDLSKKYLEWGRHNFVLNGLDPATHDFIFGDVFDWFRRLAKKGRMFDVIVLDPPTFSRSKEHGVFQAEKDYGTLVSAALPLLPRDGILLASTNAATLEPERFLEMAARAITGAGRRVTQQHYVPQPPDFPVHRREPAYLKTVWLRVG